LIPRDVAASRAGTLAASVAATTRRHAGRVVERWACGGGAWKAKLQRQRTDDSRTLTQPQLTTPTQKQGRARNCSGEARLPQLLPMPRRTLTAAVVLTTAVGAGGAIGARCFCARRMPVACRRNRIKGTRSMWIFAASPAVALSQTIGGCRPLLGVRCPCRERCCGLFWLADRCD
jgi:hypothetical protein